MKKDSLESYREKLQLLVDSCHGVEMVYKDEIELRSQADPWLGHFWKEGASYGAFFYFLRALDEAEHEIHHSVMAKVRKEIADRHLLPQDYIDAARALLADLGYSVGP